MSIILNKRQKDEIIRIIGRCEQEPCQDTENLVIHRIKRGNDGGEYTLRNIEVLCEKHHKLIHYRELGCRRG